MVIRILKFILNYYRRRKQRLHQLEKLSKPCYIDPRARISFHRSVSLGRYCKIGREVHLDGEGGLKVGDGAILAPLVVVLTSSHNYKHTLMLPYNEEEILRPVEIGAGCWIGWGALICPGVKIGDGAVVAMGSVVTKDVAAGMVVGGNPAQVIGARPELSSIDRMISDNEYYLKYLFDSSIVKSHRSTDLGNGLIR